MARQFALGSSFCGKDVSVSVSLSVATPPISPELISLLIAATNLHSQALRHLLGHLAVSEQDESGRAPALLMPTAPEAGAQCSAFLHAVCRWVMELVQSEGKLSGVRLVASAAWEWAGGVGTHCEMFPMLDWSTSFPHEQLPLPFPGAAPEPFALHLFRLPLSPLLG